MANEIVGLKIQVDSGEATKSVGSLKAQLREAQADVTKLSEKFGATSKEAVEAAKRAADLRDRIGDARALTDAFNPDAKFRAFTAKFCAAITKRAALLPAIVPKKVVFPCTLAVPLTSKRKPAEYLH